MHRLSLRPRFLSVILFLLLTALSGRVFAHRDDYINETFVFQTLQAKEFEPEMWLESASSTAHDRSSRSFAGAFEYGISDHWMVDGFARWVDQNGGDDGFQRFRAETRFRFGEEGDRPVDLAASFEAEYERLEEKGSTNTATGSPWAWIFTPRLVLSRDLGSEFNVTLNLDVGRQLGSGVRDRWIPGYSLAARYPREAFLRYGVEFRQDFGDERSTLLVPQIWLSFPHDATLKLGAGLNFDGENQQNFVRVVFEIEF